MVLALALAAAAADPFELALLLTLAASLVPLLLLPEVCLFLPPPKVLPPFAVLSESLEVSVVEGTLMMAR